jgi:type IV secretory pathway TrbF-like protein
MTWFALGRATPPPPNAPAVANGQEPTSWLEVLAAPRIDAARNFAAACIFAFAFLICSLALAFIATHHTVAPYVLQATPEGAILPATSRLVPYSPGGPERRYFIAQWVRHLLSIDQKLSESWLAESYQQTRGKATVEFTDWVKQSGPLRQLKDDPSLTRSVNISSISLLDDGVALVRVRCERRNLSHPTAQQEKFLITLHFATVTPANEEAVLKNPIGLLVSDFQIGEDMEK